MSKRSEKSPSAKIQRMYLYLSQFQFLVRHIPGKVQVVADMLSRLLTTEPPTEELSLQCIAIAQEAVDALSSPDLPVYLPEFTVHDLADSCDIECAGIEQVHGGINGHPGVQRTYEALNKFAPGHNLSVENVRNFIADCPVCQKDRLHQTATLTPVPKTLSSAGPQECTGFDLMEMPYLSLGMKLFLIIINWFTKYVCLYPIPNKEAATISKKLFLHGAMYGHTRTYISDQGPEFHNQIVAGLFKIMQVKQTFTLPYTPKSHGTEPTVGKVTAYLRQLHLDASTRYLDVLHNWASEDVYGYYMWAMNTTKHHGMTYTPFELLYGTQSVPMAPKLPASYTDQEYNSYMKHHRIMMDSINETTLNEQRARDRCITSATLKQNRYQPGDFVFVMEFDKYKKETKLNGRMKGPFEVVDHPQGHNYVQVRDLIGGSITTYDVSILKIFYGTKDQAFALASTDNEQYVVERIIGYTGEPSHRSAMTFHVLFADGTIKILPYSRDLYECIAFHNFCETTPYLRLLSMAAKDTAAHIAFLSKKPISDYYNKEAYVNLRIYGSGYYDSLSYLPNKHTTNYMMKTTYTKASNSKTNVCVTFDVFHTKPLYRNSGLVALHGSQTTLKPDDILLTHQMVRDYKIN